MAVMTRASVLHGIKDLRLEARTLEPPGPSELQILIRATGLCGSDLHYYQQHRNGDIVVKEPLSLGHESAGVVAAIGSDVQGFHLGDRVALEVGLPCGDCDRCAEGRYNICQNVRFRSSAKAVPHFQGTLQDKVNHPAAWCHKLPDNVSFRLGALLEPLGVAIHASRRAQLSRGQCILVFGAGAVGLLCAAVAKIAGATKIAIADIQEERVEFALDHGFANSGFVVPRKHGQSAADKQRIAMENMRQALIGIPGEGFDAVFECTGVEECTQSAIYLSRAGGKVVIVGMGNPIQTIPLSSAALREIDILGTFRYANTYPEAIKLVSSNHPLMPNLNPLITHHFQDLENTPQAFEMAARTQDRQGNLVLKVVLEN